jgi:hypothetical protein
MMLSIMKADDLRAEQLGRQIVVEYDDVEIRGRLEGFRHTATTEVALSDGTPLRFSTECTLVFRFGDAIVPRHAKVTLLPEG